MKDAYRLLMILLLFLSASVHLACSTAPPANTNQPVANRQNANANTPPANTSATKPATPADSTTGSIEVTSVPPGARVLLIAVDDDTAGEPQQKGSTPTTITGVKPGKYTVDLEKSGYRFYQKTITVKRAATAKIAATLRKR